MAENQGTRPNSDMEELGRDFEAQSSPSFGGDLGTSFEEHNSSREEWERERHAGRRRLLWIGGAVLALIVIAAVFFSTKPKKGSSGKASHSSPSGGSASAGSSSAAGGGKRGAGGPVAITAAQTETGNINIYDDALGTVTPVNTVTVYSQITGKVLQVTYREGQYVQKGQLLVEIDPRPYQASLTQAEGTLEHDRGVLAEAEIDLARYQAAYARNAIARQTLEDQEQTVAQDRGTVKADEGTVAYDKVELSYCYIVAPISGRVGLRLVDPGNTVFSGNSTTLVVITQVQPITVVFNVSEDDLPQIQAQLKTGRTLEADAWDRADVKQIAKGQLRAVDNQIDTTTGTLKFRAMFGNGNMALFPNQFVNIRLLVKTLQNVVLVPAAAVQHNGTAAFVYMVKASPKGGQVVAVQGIQVLTSDEKQAAVTGVGSGVQVATSGFDRLDSGVPVHAQAGAPKGSATGSPTGSTNAPIGNSSTGSEGSSAGSGSSSTSGSQSQ